MTGIYSTAGFMYQANVAAYCLLRSILKKRFVSCSLEIDVELDAGEYKSMDILIRQKNPTEHAHFFEVKDVANLHKASMIRPTINDLFAVMNRAIEPMDYVYLVHSAPTIGALLTLRNSGLRRQFIEKTRRMFHYSEKWRVQTHGMSKQDIKTNKSAFDAECNRYANEQTQNEHDTIEKFSDRFKLLHLPNCTDRLFKISDIELRIESAIRNLLANIGKYDISDYRAVRTAIFDYIKNSIVDASQRLKADAQFAVKTIPLRRVELNINEMFIGGNSIYHASGCENGDQILELKRDLVKLLSVPDAQLDLTPEFEL